MGDSLLQMNAVLCLTAEPCDTQPPPSIATDQSSRVPAHTVTFTSGKSVSGMTTKGLE